jgi:hypothetical protein
MKTAIIDTSSAILLFKSGIITDFLSAYNVVMTKSVQDEILQDGYPGSNEFKNYFKRKSIKLISGKKITRNNSTGLLKLDKGERDSINVYLNGIGDFVVIDDGQGASFCKKEKIPYINALLVPRILFDSKKINRHIFKKKMGMVIGIGRYTQPIIEYAYNCPNKDLECFLP